MRRVLRLVGGRSAGERRQLPPGDRVRESARREVREVPRPAPACGAAPRIRSASCSGGEGASRRLAFNSLRLSIGHDLRRDVLDTCDGREQPGERD